MAVLVVNFIAAKKHKSHKDFDSSLQLLAFAMQAMAGDFGGTSRRRF